MKPAYHAANELFALPVLTLKSATARDFHRCAQCLSNEMPRLTMIGRVPVLGLVLELEQRRLPASRCPPPEPMPI